MNYSSRLISNVRALFGLGRLLAVGGFVIFPILHFASAGQIPEDLGAVFFRTPTLTQKGATAETSPAMLENLRADISVSAITDADRSFLLRIGVVEPMVVCVFSFLICHWLWQLCRTVERGEVFSAGNVKLLRCVGGLLIVEALLVAAYNFWKIGAVASFVRDRITVAGLEIVAAPSDPFLFHPEAMVVNFNQIITGMVVLCLTEVFRQGLQLKQEADLTV